MWLLLELLEAQHKVSTGSFLSTSAFLLKLDGRGVFWTHACLVSAGEVAVFSDARWIHSLWSLVWPQVKRGGRCGYQWVPQFLGAGVSSLNFTFRCLCIFLRSALPALPVGMCGLPRSPFRELGVCLRQSPFLSSPSDRPCGLKMSSKYILLCARQRSLNFAINGNVTDLLWLRAKS